MTKFYAKPLFLLFCILGILFESYGQNRIIVNPSFETGSGIPHTTVAYLASQAGPNPQIDGWYSTHPVFNNTQFPIEHWRSGFNSVPAQQGDYFVELNVSQSSRLYQIVYLVNGETFNWEYYHRQRIAGATEQIEYSIYSQNGNTKLFTLDTHTATSTSSWDRRSGTFTFTGTTGVYQIGFEATTAGGSGNFLDNITIGLTALSEFTRSAVTVSETNGAYRPYLRINGEVKTASTVTFEVSGGNASEGVEYSFPTKTITIPAGRYSLADSIPIGLTLLNNQFNRGTRNLTLRVSQVTGDLSNLDANGDGFQQNLTITIQDDESNDFDGDGVPDNQDEDDDNDGISDIDEGFGGVIPANPSSTVSYSTSQTAANGPSISSPSSGYAITSNNSTGRFAFTATAPGESGSGGGTGTVSRVNINVDFAPEEVVTNVQVNLTTGAFDDGLYIEVDGVVIVNFNYSNYNNEVIRAKFGGGSTSYAWAPWTNQGNPQLELDLINRTVRLMVDVTDGSSPARQDILSFISNSKPNPVPLVDFDSGVTIGSGFQNQDGPGSISTQTLTFSADVRSHKNSTSGSNVPGQYDFRNLDSDGDGCFDVVEAGFLDPDGDGKLGPIPVVVDPSTGRVTSGTGYTTPKDGDGNGIFDFQEAGTANTITTQPNSTIGAESTGSAVISVVGAGNNLTYQWQVSTDGGATFTDLVDGTNYANTQAANLTINNVPISFNNYQYRVIVGNSAFACNPVTSSVSTLQVRTIPGVSGTNLWLKANAGATNSGANLTGWTDQAGINTFTVTGTPGYKANAINFNPAVTFNNTDAVTALPSNRLNGNTNITYVDGFAVYKHTDNNSNFLGATAPSGAYGKAIFASAGANTSWVGNGEFLTYSSFTAAGLTNSYGLVNMDVSLVASPFATGRYNGANQTLTAGSGSDFASLVFSPMIGGTNNAGSQPATGWAHAKAEVAEIVLYPSSLSAADKLKVESYLAIKYGIHLAGNYVKSDGTTIWDASANASYHHDVFGIGKDDTNGLNQSSSNSINTGSGDGSGQAGKGNLVIQDPTNLDNEEFLLVGHNNGPLTEQSTDLPIFLPGGKRLGREWKVKQTGNVGAVTLKFDLTGLTVSGTTAVNFLLLVDRDGNGDFTNGQVDGIFASSFNSNVVEFNQINLPDNAVFTLLTLRQDAGGVSQSILWYAADKAVDFTGGSVNQWANIGSQFTALANASGNARPTLNTSGVNQINFNRSVSFDGVDDRMITQKLPEVLGLSGSSQTSTQFAVYRVKGSGDAIYSMDNGSGQVKISIQDNGVAYQNTFSASPSSSPGNGQIILTDMVSTTNSNGTKSLSLNTNGIAGQTEAGSYSSPGDSLAFVIGGYSNTFNEVDISELVVYPKVLTDTERKIVQSYLAIKYGITLGNRLNPFDYINSQQQPVWTGTVKTNFQYDIFGIGRDDKGGLLQASSNSMNTGNGDGTGISGKGNIVIRNASSLDDGDFLMIGHNADSLTTLTTNIPANLGSFRLKREWKVQRTGDPGTIQLTVDLSGISITATQTNEIKLLIDIDGNGDFTDGNPSVLDASSFNNSIAVFNGVNLPNDAVFTIVTGPGNPSWTLTKTSSTPSFNAAGNPIDYKFVLENTGNVAISNVNLQDLSINQSPTLDPNSDTGSDQILGIGESWTYSLTYQVTQDNLDAGSFQNIATATGTSAAGAPTPASDTVTVNAIQSPAWTLTKSTSATDYSQVGEVILYEFQLSNTGNVSISNVSLTDNLLLSPPVLTSGDGGAAGKLEVGETWVYGGSYTITQVDIDAGSYSNTATANGTPAGGSLTPAVSNTVTVNAVQNPSWTVTKSTNTSDYDQVGDVISYQILVENTGNVSVTGVTLTDPNTTISGTIQGDNAPTGTLDVGETWTYSATYTIIQADIDAGSYSNTATANGTPAGGILAPGVSNTVTVDAVPDPELTVQKTSSSQPYSQLGQVLNYTIRVTNSGNVSITQVVVSDPGADAPGPAYASGDLGNDQVMAPGETWVYNAKHTIVQADLDAGSYTNIATATGNPAQGILTDATDDETIQAVQVPNYNVIKRADKTGYSQAGEVITYGIVIINSGNVTLTDVEIDDPLTGLMTTIPSITPSQTVVATSTYTVTQTDIENGSIANTASVSTDDPKNPGSTIDKVGNLTINAAQTPRFDISKSADKTTITTAGEVITYTILVENTGNLILENVEVNDPLISGSPLTLTSGDTNTDGKLDPDEIWTYQASYSVTQSDIDQGGVTNSATVSGESILGNLQDDNASIFVPADQMPDWTIQKTVDSPGTYENAGDVLSYTISVENTGNISITDVSLFDLKTANPVLVSGDVSNPGTLDVGETWVYTTTYTVTQADVDAGSFTNSVSATSKSPAGNLPEISDDATATATPNPSWTLTKSAGTATYDRAGQTITYTLLVDNTGNVSIDNPAVSDPKATTGPSFVSGDTDSDGDLDPNEIWTYTATYSIKQADLDAGSFTNSATASGTPPGGTLPNATDDETINAIFDPSVELTKNVSPSTYSMAGEVLTYTLVVTNNGNLSLSSLELTDPFFGAGVFPVSDLAPGQTFTYSNTYTVTQNDIDNGPVTNTATVEGKDSQGGDVTDSDSATSTPVKNPSFEVNKTTTSTGFNSPGQVITYSIQIQNTGNVTLDNVSVDDSIIAGSDLSLVSGDGPTVGKLDVGETWDYQGTYTITQDDVDNGRVQNVVSVELTDPDNNTLTDSDTVTVNGSKTNSISLTKVAGQQGYDTAGDILTYTIFVQNTGNTRVDNVQVTDDLISLTYISGDLSPPSGPGRNNILDPGEIWTFTGAYTVTQDDVDNGTVTNNATVTGTDPDNDTLTDTDTDIVTGSKNPSIDVVKSAQPNSFSNVDEVITYTIIVRNTGNVSISDLVIDDPLINPLTFLGVDTDNDSKLDPTEIWTYQGTYTITQADLDRGNLTNTVTVTGKDPDGGNVGDGDSNVIGGAANPSIDLEKTALAFGYSFVGEIVPYELRVRNNGNVDLENVVLEDSRLGYTNIIGDMAPGEVQVFTVNYSITQQDLDEGRILNIAEVVGDAPLLPSKVRDISTVELNGSQNPKIDILKSVAEKGYDSAGDLLNYTIIVLNTGNVTLNSVQITDPLTGLDVNLPVLSVSSSQTYTETYTVTQDDLNAGRVINTAEVNARGPFGQPIKDEQTVTVIASKNPSIRFTKTATPASVSQVGDVISYLLKVENTGNLSYFVVNTDDPLTNLSESEPRLDPGQTITYTTQYTVTQVDLDRGYVENDAELVAQVDGSKVTRNQTVRTPVNQNPKLKVTKTPSISQFAAPGVLINYTITVENTGNITVTNLSVSDPKTAAPQFTGGDTGNDGILSPGEIWTYTTSYTTTQADVDNGKFENTATATGTLPSSASISETGKATVNATINARWTINKTATNNPKNFRAVGEILNYQIVLANTGNVTIKNVVVSDPGASVGPTLQSGDTNTNNLLDVNETWTYSASYTATQADLDRGRYINEVTASGQLTFGNLANVKDTEDVPALALPGWKLDKISTTSPNNYNRPGVALSYSLLLTNTGNVTISNINVVDPGVSSGPTFRGGDLNNNGKLEPREVWSYTANYTTKQQDVDNGEFVNVATATGTPTQGNLAPAIGRDTIPAIVNPVLTVNKRAQQSGYNAVGETLTYTIEIRNDGNVNLTDIAVTDPKTGLNDFIRFLGVGQSFTYTEQYLVNQNDIDAGTIVNTAEAVGKKPDGGSISDSDTETINGAQTPGLNFGKGVQQSGYFQPGEVITYNLYAQNSGNVSIFDLRIEDPKVGLDTLIPLLSPGEFLAFDVQYLTTQQDVDVGELINVATATGRDLNNNILSATDSKTLLATQNPKLKVAKSSSTPNYDAVGDVINYTFLVENVGNVSLFDVIITDPKAEIDPTANPIPVLAPGQSVIVNAVHTVTQPDLDAGRYENIADVEGKELDGTLISRKTNRVTVPAVQRPDFTLTKSSSTASYDAVGNVLNYTILVQNTGNVTLTALSVSDPKAVINSGIPIPILFPGQVATVTASHTVVQADLDAGRYINTASGTGLDPNSKLLSRNSNTVTIPALQNPVLEIVKSARQSTYDRVGERITYDLVVTNRGNVTISKVVVTDPNTVVSTGQFKLSPGQSKNLTATHDVTQADLDAGEYRNVATATGRTPQSVAVQDLSNEVVITAIQTPGIAASKSTATSSYSAVGQEIQYVISVENTGNVTLSNINITDPKAEILGTNPIPSLAPGQVVDVPARHVVAQVDLDAGSYSNTATASGVDVNSNTQEAITNQITVPAALNPGIEVVKTPSQGIYDQVGTIINYDIEVTNTGNVTLDQVELVDNETNLTVIVGTLDPGQTEVYTTSYTIQQADLDAGLFVNTASVTGVSRDPSATSVSDVGSATVRAIQNPEIALLKTTPNGPYSAVDEVIDYELVVTNTGNQTLENTQLVDSKLGLNVSIGELQVGASSTVTGIYSITQTDLDNGSLVNTATVTAVSPANRLISDIDSVEVLANQIEQLTFTKQGDRFFFFAPNQQVTYDLEVSNTGNVTLSNVVINDPKLSYTSPTLTLNPGASTVVQVTYDFTQVDLDNGDFINTATVNAESPSGNPLQLQDSWTVQGIQLGGIQVRKLVTPRIFQADGDLLVYDFIITNTGNVTLDPVQISDPRIGYSEDLGLMAPGASITRSFTYTVQQSDVDDPTGIIRNEVTVNATEPDQTVISAKDVAFAISTGRPAVELDKFAIGKKSGYANPGDQIIYELIVTNTGDVTLIDLVLEDSNTGYTETIGTLPVGQSVVRSVTYTVDQDDIDAGEVVNIATVTGRGEGGGISGASVRQEATEIVQGIQNPVIQITKTANKAQIGAAGEVIQYTIEVENVGNQTLFQVNTVDLLVGLDETVAALAPTDPPLIYTRNYTVTQADIDLLVIPNSATATAENLNGVQVSDQASLRIPVLRNARLTLDKSADVSTVNDAGDVVNYTLVVSNPGNLTLTGGFVVDAKINLDERNLNLAPGQSLTFTKPYTVSQDDINRGFIDNTAGSIFFTPFRQPIFANDSLRVLANQAGDLTLTKTVDKVRFAQEGEELVYTFIVTNTGNLTLDPVNLEDPLLGVTTNLGLLQPTQSATFTSSYFVNQGDLDRGFIRNVAKAEGTGPNQVVYSDTDRAVSLVDASPSLSLIKFADVTDFDAVGDAINYSLVVENTGNLTLSNVVLADNLLGINQNLGDLAPQDIQTITGIYSVDQADLNAGEIINIALVSGVSPFGRTVNDQATLTITGTQSPDLFFEKTADKTQVSTLGELIEYTLDVRNTGNVTLSNVTVIDPLTNLSVNVGSLAPNVGNARTTTHAVTQQELDAGFVINTATATGVDPMSATLERQSTVTVTVVQNSMIELVKTANKSTYTTAGEEIEYTLDISNTGNVTLTNVVVKDPLTGLDQNLGTLIPGESIQVTSIYTVEQADIDFGFIDNIATATALDPGNQQIEDQDNLTISANQNPGLTFQKVALVNQFDAAGDVIDYTLTVTNAGNVTLTNVVVTDPLTGTNQNLGTLSPGQVEVVTTSYTTNQVDMDAGVVNNTATVVATEPRGQILQLQDSETVTGIIIGEITVIKTADVSEFTQAGDLITYSFEVSNTGNVTLFSVDIQDPILNLVLPIGQMAPGQTETRTVTYTATQDDVDQGGKINLAFAEGFDPIFTFVFDLDLLFIPAIQNPDIEIVKSALTSDYDAPGDVLEYAIEVENTGNVTLSNAEIIDPLTGTDVTVGDLAPGQTASISTTYTVTQADVDAGSVTNTATVEATDPTLAIISDTDDALVNAIQTPSISLQKTADPLTFDAVGNVITYTLTVQNTGNVTLDPVTLNDPIAGINAQVLGSFAPGDSQVITATYTITQIDIDQGQVINQATVTGTDPNNTDQIATATATVTAIQTPDLTLTKTANPTTYQNVGDNIRYEFVVTNSGNVTLDQVSLNDPLAGIIGQSLGTLAPAESKTLSGIYPITQTDLDAGLVINNATATAVDTNQNPLEAAATATVTAIQLPSIILEKTADVSSFDAEGDLINYQLVATNKGNVTLDNVTFNDPIAGITNSNLGSFAPGETLTVTGSYSIQLADLNAGERENTATVTATGPQNQNLETTDQLIVPADVLPAIQLVKVADPQFYSIAGEVVTYYLTVTNVGNVSLNSIALQDPLIAAAPIAISDLDPGQSEVQTLTYTVSQTDLDLGQIENTASVTGTDPFGTVVGESAIELITAAQNPVVEITKTADRTSFQSVDEVITYTLEVENIGNLTLTDVVVTDNLTGFTSAPVILDPAPASGTSVSYTTTYTVTQVDLDRGFIENLAEVNATSSAGPVMDQDDVRINALTNPAIELEKSANPTVVVNTGEIVTFTFVVTNVGNITVEDVEIDDPLINFNQVVGDLSPGESFTASAARTVTLDALQQRIFINLATATAVAVDGTNLTATDRAIVVSVDDAGLELIKTPIEKTYSKPGDIINYELEVVNIGNFTLENLLLNDPLTGTVDLSLSNILPGSSTVVTVSYTVDQDDLDQGFVTNTATVTGNGIGSINPLRDEDSAIVTASRNPSITLNKNALVNTVVQAGDVIPYELTVTNTGNVTLVNVTLNDALTGINNLNLGTLAPGASTVIPTSYTTDQNDFDTQISIPNTATVTGTTTAAIPTVVTDTDEERVFTTKAPKIQVTKTAQTQIYIFRGQVVNYEIVVKNVGNLTLLNTTVLDDLTQLQETIPSLAPNASVTYTTSYTVTQSDVDNGSIVNTAGAIGFDPFRRPVKDDATETINAVRGSRLLLSKVPTPATYSKTGDVIDYELTVINVGNLTITNVTIDDPLIILGPDKDVGTLLPFENAVVTGSYTITQADVDAGEFVNIASATGSSVINANITAGASATVTAIQSPGIGLQKIASPTTYDQVGDVISYDLIVTNTGNLTLNPVILEDPLVNISSLDLGSFAPADVITVSRNYVIDQQDLDRGFVINVASVTGLDPNQSSQFAGATATVTAVQTPGISLTKVATPQTYDQVGDIINYNLEVTNTGNVTLDNVTVTDPLTSLNVNIGSLAPGQDRSGVVVYTITQDDVDNGQVVNIATAAGTDPNQLDIETTANETILAIQRPSIELTKNADLNIYDAVDEVITYTLTVTNSGNLTIENVVLTDPLTGLSDDIGTMDPGQVEVVTATYTVTQADLDKGSITNDAEVTGVAKNQTPVSDQAQVVTPSSSNPALKLTKVANPTTYNAEGEQITYTLTVSNVGNLTIADVVVEDPLTGTSVNVGDLAPTESQVINANYSILLSDIDKGTVVNVATATGLGANNQSVTATATATIRAIQDPALRLQKTANVIEYDRAGQVIGYTLEVTNTGNETLFDVTVVDPLTNLNRNIGQLVPTQVVFVQENYTVTQQDVDNGSILNVANARGRDLSDRVVSSTDRLEIPAIQTPGIALTKTANPTTYDQAGDLITYTLIVTNTGNVTLTN
ncbi:DUF7507 domain-containing protein, partial [Algoriphagus taiwanensis]